MGVVLKITVGFLDPSLRRWRGRGSRSLKCLFQVLAVDQVQPRQLAFTPLGVGHQGVLGLLLLLLQQRRPLMLEHLQLDHVVVQLSLGGAGGGGCGCAAAGALLLQTPRTPCLASAEVGCQRRASAPT